MRVAEELLAQEGSVEPYLRLRVKAAAGVIKVGMPLVVESTVFLRAQPVEPCCCGVFRMRLEELRVRFALGRAIVSQSCHLLSTIANTRGTRNERRYNGCLEG